MVPIAIAGSIYLAATNGFLAQPVTRWISAKLGRTLLVEGGLRIELGRVTRLSAAGLHLANAPWADHADMLVAGRVEIEIDTRSLLQHTLIVRRLAVDDLVLELERNAAGQSNWDFNLHRSGSSTALPLVIEQVSLPGARIRLTGSGFERPLDLALDVLEQRERSDGMLDLKAQGHANDTGLELRAVAGPFGQLVAGKNFSVQALGHLGEIAFNASGMIDSLAAPVNTKLTMDLKAPDADYLTGHLGLRSLGTGPVALEVAIEPGPASNGVHGTLSGQIGEFELTALGSSVERAEGKRYAVEARVSGPDLARVGSLTGIHGLPVEPFKLQLDVKNIGGAPQISRAELKLADGRAVLSGYLGPGGVLAGSELDFTVGGADLAKLAQRLGVAPVVTGPFEGTGSLHHARPGETLLRFDLTTPVGKLSLNGPIGAAPDYYGTRMAVVASGSDFAPLGKALRFSAAPSGAFIVNGSFEWIRAGLALRGTTLKVGADALKVDGSIGRRPATQGADLRFDLQGADAAQMADRFGIKGLPASAFRVAGRFQRQKDRSIFSGVKATVAKASLQLDGTIGDGPDWLGTALTLQISGPELESFRGMIPGATFPRGAFRAAGQITLRDKALRLEGIEATMAGAKGKLTAEIMLPLTSAKMQFNVDATVPDLAALLPDLQGAAAAGKNLTISALGSRLNERWSLRQLRLAGDNGSISTQGEVVFLPRLVAKDVQIELRTASLRNVVLPSGHRLPDQPLELRAKASRSAKDVILDDLSGKIGTSDFAGRIAMRGLDGKPDFDVRLESKQLDLNPYVNKPQAASPPAPAPAGAPRNEQRLVIPAEALHLPDLDGFTGRLALHAQELQLFEQSFSELQVQATLRNGRLHVDPLTVTGSAGQISAQLDLAAKGNGVAAKLSGTGSNLRLSPLPATAGGPNASVFTAQVDLQGSGASLRELASTLNGRMRLVGVGGRVANSLLLASSNSFVRQLVSSLNPMASRQPTTEVVCVAYLIGAKDGLLTTNPALVMRTAEVDIVSNGSVDLRTERIDFNFKTSARRGLGFGVAQLINPYIKVTGTLGRPGVTLDPTGTLVNGGAAFATAGLSVVATTLWDRVVHERDPCGAAVAEADRRAQN